MRLRMLNYLCVLILAGAVALTGRLVSTGPAARAKEPDAAPPAADVNEPKQIAELLGEAASAAREIRDAGPSAYALLEIAGVTARAGDRETAKSLVREALELFPKVKSTANLEKVSVAELAAALQVRLEDVDGALATVELLKDEEEQDSVRLRVISELLSLDGHEQALDICQQFADDESRSEAYAAIAASLAAADRIDEAKTVLKKIESESEQSYALVAMAEARLEAGDMEGAEDLAETIDDAASRFTVLAEIVEAHLDAKQLAAAKKTFTKAESAASLASIHEGLRLIELHAEIGQVDQAVAIADALADREARDGIVHAIVIWLAGQGETKKAARLMQTIETEPSRAPLLAAIALGQALSGHIDEGIRTARDIDDDPHALGSTLAHLAAMQIEKEDREAAKKTLDAALAAARQLDADEIWSKAADADVGISQTWALVDLLLDIASLRAEMGEREAAREEFAQLLKTTEAHAKRVYLRASLVGEIARVESRSGLAADAIAWSRKLTGAADRSSALLGVVEGLLAEGDMQNEDDTATKGGATNDSKAPKGKEVKE